MERACSKERIWDGLWFLTCLAASSVWCVTAAQQVGVTFDEPVYITRGMEGWRSGSHRGLLRLGTMPLPIDLQTLPLYLWERGHGTILDPGPDLDQMLPWARAVTLVFWGLLLTYGWLAGWQLAGRWGARLAVAFLACEPSLLAHASLATTDIAVTACLLALVYHFRTGRESGWLRRVGVPTLWFAAAVLAKASGLVFGLLCLLVVELERLARQSAFRPPKETAASPALSARAGPAGTLRRGLGWLKTCWILLRPWRRDLAQIVAGGLVLVFLYCGSDWQPEPSFVAWAQNLPEGPGRQLMVGVAERLCIFSNAGEALARQVRHNMKGHGAYLLGRSHPRALWYYFPVVLTIKLSVPVLIAPLLLVLIRPRVLANWACLAALVLLGFSLTCRVQIGIRLMLPLVALAMVGLAAAGVRAAQACGSTWTRRAFTLAAGGGLIWTTWAAAAIWPHGLVYANDFWGDRAHAYLRVSDSNYDWGQGLPELRRWQQQQALATLDVWYFGTDPLIKQWPLREAPFHRLPIRDTADVRARVRGRYLAVSTTLLYGVVSNSEAARCALAFLRTQQPVARTTTFFIYDFTHQPADASVRPNLMASSGR